MNTDIQDKIKAEAERKYPFVWPKNKHGEDIVQVVGANPPGSAKARKVQEVFIAGANHVLQHPELLREQMDGLITWLKEENYLGDFDQLFDLYLEQLKNKA